MWGDIRQWLAALGTIAIGVIGIIIAYQNYLIIRQQIIFTSYKAGVDALQEYNRVQSQENFEDGNHCLEFIVAVSQTDNFWNSYLAFPDFLFQISLFDMQFPISAKKSFELCLGSQFANTELRLSDDNSTFQINEGSKRRVYRVFSNNLDLYINTLNMMFTYWQPENKRVRVPASLKRFDADVLIDNEFGQVCSEQALERKFFTPMRGADRTIEYGVPQLLNFLDNCTVFRQGSSVKNRSKGG